MAGPIYVLGGYQTDFSANWARNGMELADGIREVLAQGLDAVELEPRDLETVHVGNFAAELFCNQGHLGGLVAAAHPDLAGVPASRHEGACASGSLAALAASAELEAGRYGLAAVIGIEQMRNVPGDQAAKLIGPSAMWSGHECQDVKYPWPHVFSEVAEEYDRRYGLKSEHLWRIAEINFANARRNPNAQTRRWQFTPESFTADAQANPVIDGRIRKQDCGQISDGAAAVLLASEEGLKRHNLTPRARIVARVVVGSDPVIMLDGPIPATHKILAQAGLTMHDIDTIEINEAFASVVLAWMHELQPDPARVNPTGGAIALGHPLGATGAKLMTTMLHRLERTGGRYGLQTMCIGHGMATATIIERV
jgi:acetyl-CoA C-acetyltransferase